MPIFKKSYLFFSRVELLEALEMGLPDPGSLLLGQFLVFQLEPKDEQICQRFNK